MAQHLAPSAHVILSGFCRIESQQRDFGLSPKRRLYWSGALRLA